MPIKQFALFVAILVVFSGANGTSSRALAQTVQTGAPITDGIRISIAVNCGTLLPTGAEFWVTLQNTSSSDFVVNVGQMLANGKVMFPTAVRLFLTDPAGNTRELQFSDRRYPIVAGRMDDFTIALRAGALYAIPVSLDQYWSPTTKDFELRLAPGRYRIRAQFEGLGATTKNLDMQGVALLNFWTGTVISDVLEFEVS